MREQCIDQPLLLVSIFPDPLEMADLRVQLRELEIGNVEETDKELGRGAYGVVVELKVNGLRYCRSRRQCSLNRRYIV